MLPTFEDIRPAPSIAIVDAPAKVTHEDVTIKVRVTDEGGGVGNIRLYVDGTTIAQQAARDIISVPFKTSGRLYIPFRFK